MGLYVTVISCFNGTRLEKEESEGGENMIVWTEKDLKKKKQKTKHLLCKANPGVRCWDSYKKEHRK